MRLDKFLKVSRIIKRRTVAKLVCDNKKIKINGKVVKSSATVKENVIFGLSNTKIDCIRFDRNYRN